jgi:fructokinase
VPARLLARIADDLFGRLVRAHLAGNGVDLSHTVRAQEPTSLAIIALGEDGVPEYDFRIDGTADWQWQEVEFAAALDGQLAALHAGSLALTMPPGVLAASIEAEPMDWWQADRSGSADDQHPCRARILSSSFTTPRPP